MQLELISIENFRCFGSIQNVPIHRLTVFIGENDAGKTMFLSALEILLTNKRPSQADFRRLNDSEQSDDLTITGSFSIQEHDEIEEDLICPETQKFILSKVFTTGTSSFTVRGKGYSDSRWNTFNRQSASAQKELLESISLDPETNNQRRQNQYLEAVENGILNKLPMDLEVRWSDIERHVPLFFYTSPVDYKKPDTMVQRTMQRAVDACLRPLDSDTDEQELLPELRRVERKIRETLNEEIVQIEEIIRRANPKLINIQVEPTIDFARSVSTTNIMLDLGEGLQYVDTFGEGTKKKLWLGLLDWERDVERGSPGRPIVRAYDEPDINLDYEAKRKLFANILADTQAIDSNIQSVICTHEVTMIDHAPANAINLIRVNDAGIREIEYLIDSGDDGVRDYLAMLGRSVGIRNSAVFYEKAFIVVEGESEEGALPILYQHTYGHSYVQDRIQLINLRSCGAWKSVLNILLNNRANICVMLLDQDCTALESSGYVTDAVLEEIGYPAEWKNTNCFFIGTKEFEDAFQTSEIVQVLNQHWPKDGTEWNANEIDQFRNTDGKFSSDLLDHVRRTCSPRFRNSARKPDFAEKLACLCSTNTQIPIIIQNVFTRVRQLAGIIEDV